MGRFGIWWADFIFVFFFFQAEDGIRDYKVTGVQTCALPISHGAPAGAGDGIVRRLVHGRGAGRRRARRGRPAPPWSARHHRGDRSRLVAALPERAPPAGGGCRLTLALAPPPLTAIRRPRPADYPFQ